MNKTIPDLPVNDKLPRFYMYDIARGAYLRPETLQKVLRCAAANKFTHFIPYMENMIHLPSMSKGAPSCAYTREDWASFQETAKEAGIEIVPHFNVIGHSNKICLAYPELTGNTGKAKCSGNGDDTPDDPFYFAEIDPTVPAAQQWMLRCLEEFCSFSQSEYFLIGGDEWNTPPHLLKQENIDAGEVWCTYMNLAVDYLVSRNRTPIIWHDMLVHYPHILDKLSKKAVIAFWFYDIDSGYPFLQTLKKYGFRTIMATGLCAGSLTKRRERALRCAVWECEKYQADGFMVTTWSDGRWERQAVNIELCGKMLSGEKISSIYPETLSALLCLARIRNSGYEKEKKSLYGKVLDLLEDPAWLPYPEYRDLLKATVMEDVDYLRKTYEIHHYPEGTLYKSIQVKNGYAAGPVPEESVRDLLPESFGVELIRDAVTGNTIRFRNGNESFVLYPDYGGKMQDWHIGGKTLIPNGLPSFLKKNPHQQPGGYKSYSSAGFMPVWDIGTHLNPNIIGNYPWNFKLVSSGPEEAAVEMFQTFSHVEIQYRISIKKGVHGFRWEARAVNRLPHIKASFGWNFLLAGSRILETEFVTENNSSGVKIPDFVDDLPILDGSTLLLKTPHWNMKLITPPEQSAGFAVDWGSTWMTPDLHGIYRPLEVGEVYETQWEFILDPLEE